MTSTLTVTDRPEAVPAVRGHLRARLRGTPLEHRSADAELIVTELVTNATLYGAAPVTVDVRVLADRVRLEVADGSSEAPVRPLQGPEAMTGRGLLLVDSFSDRWGVHRRADGKTVWAELDLAATAPAGPSGEPEPRVARAGRPAVVDDAPGAGGDADDEPRYEIELGDVPTDLLVAAKAHVDNLVREFTLVSTGAASGQSREMPRHLAELVEIVTSRFAEARQEIKRQAIAAKAAGRERTELVLHLPLSAAKAGRDYLAALDEVDTYARAARLLTVESPPQHRQFRRWYVGALIEQLQAFEHGEPPPRPVAFEEFLLGELQVVATAQRATDRSARLQRVTASLAGATSIDEVAATVVSQGLEALDASGGALLVPRGDAGLDVLAAIHYSDRLLGYLRTEGMGARMPAAHAFRTGRPVWLESLDRREGEFPQAHVVEPDAASVCAVPVALAGRVLGVLRLSFASPRLFDEAERAFVQAFVAQTAQAMARVELYDAERRARAEAETAAGRLSRLNQVTALLAGASEVDEIGRIVAAEAHRTLGAAISALCLVEGGALRTVQIQGAQPGTLPRWATFPVQANLPASEAVRTNAPVVIHSRDELEHRYPALAGQSPYDRGLVAVPLSVGGRALGVLSLSFDPPFALDDEVVGLLSTLGRQCALAIERANLLAAERAARKRSAFLADGTARVTSSLDREETMANLCDLMVPELADWTAVYLAESGRVVAATVRHRDAALTPRLQGLQREHPIAPDADGDVAEALRSGLRSCHRTLSAQQRDEVCGLFGGTRRDTPADVRPNSLLVVPFVRAERILGVLVLARVAGPAYTDGDLLLASELADRAAVALDNATRFRREREVALTLQRSLLPQVLPRVPGLALAWRYFPGAAGTHVGGDWYDVIPLERGRVALIIGDVMGRGLQAAAVMGQLRATARAHVTGELSPAQVLARIDTELMRLEQDQIATVLLALLDPAAGTLVASSAGHLPPLVRAEDGSAHYLDVTPGPPLGTGVGSYTDLEVTLPPGATVLLYTDGLVEDRRLPIDEGLATLAAAATGSREPELMCDRALVALGRDTAHDDDTAMLAVHVGAL